MDFSSAPASPNHLQSYYAIGVSGLPVSVAVVSL